MSDRAPILRSLETIYNPRSSNEDRKQATIFLEDAKDLPEAPSVGLALARDRLGTSVVRHYGLSLLEHCIKYKWEGYTVEQMAQIRSWLLELAHDIRLEDPSFIRNKTAQVLEELAEKIWGLSWLDFDEQLCILWEKSITHKELVLHVLETLSDRVFGKDETATGMRGSELGRYCVEIFTPLPALESDALIIEANRKLRYNNDGWLGRALTLLQQSLQAGGQTQTFLRDCNMMIFSLLRSGMAWLSLKGVASTNCVEVLCNCLGVQDAQVQMAALEVLHTLYHRTNYRQEDVEQILQPLLTSNGISLLRVTYEKLCSPIDEMDEMKYATLKRLAEVICSLGTNLEQNSWLLEIQDTSGIDFDAFVDLLMQILHHPSLAVSIPILYLWTKLLNVRQVRYSPQFTRVMSDLLGICNQRLIRFELLASESEDPTVLYLVEDIDTIPERHAFLGNYRRFCNNIIERVVRRSPCEAITHLLSQSGELMRSLTAREESGVAANFATDTMEQLTVESQCTVVTTGVKSYVRWLQGNKSDDTEFRGKFQSLHRLFEEWCKAMLDNCTRDPITQRRILSLVTEVAVSALPASSRASIDICERVLSSRLATGLGLLPYDEAVKELQLAQPRELQRLAVKFADQLLPMYENIKASIERRLSSANAEERLRLEHEAFLLTIIQRSSSASKEDRRRGLTQMVDPLIQSWQNERLHSSEDDRLGGFRTLLGLEEFPSYFLSRKAFSIAEWSSVPLDAYGMTMKEVIQSKVEQLPLQATRSLLSVCTSVGGGGGGGGSVRALDGPEVEQLRLLTPVVLPPLLNLIGLSHAFNNPDKWQNMPPEMRTIIARTVQDRVWQNGISSESRDAFFARVRESRSSLEGLASATRGAVRSVRELSMWTLHSLSDLGETFYGHHDLPQPLARALYEDAMWLSPHQLSALLSLSSTLIDRCPGEHREHFLPSLLIPLFKVLDGKMTAEWEKIQEDERNGLAGAESLDHEMKSESVLRNLTYSAVMLVSHLLGHPSGKGSKMRASPDEASIRGLILKSPEILESLALFSTHTLRMHDNRSCGIISRVLRSLIPEFQWEETSKSATARVTIDAKTASSVREFFSTEVLQACITSIHEPYFAELQKDLAAVVASILLLYMGKTETPRQVLLSLPNMGEVKVARHFEQLRKAANNERQQRAVVLSLLDGLRGVSIYEQGKIAKIGRRSRTAMEAQFMIMAMDDDGGGGGDRGKGDDSPEIGGLIELFG